MLTRRMLKLGYKASAEQFGPRELVEYAVLAEELGHDTVVVSDHFQPSRHDGGPAPFSFSWLAAVGERTSRIGLGTSVVAPSCRYHPGIVAQAMATLGVLYPGRVFLGVGTGESMNETPLGVHWPDQKERFQRLFANADHHRAVVDFADAVPHDPAERMRGRIGRRRHGSASQQGASVSSGR